MVSVKSNAVKIIIAIICIIGLACWYLLGIESDKTESSSELTEVIQPTSKGHSAVSNYNIQKTDKQDNKNTRSVKPPLVISNLTLLATVVANPAENSSAVIQFDSKYDNYEIGETINNTAVMLKNILTDSVVVSLEGKEYRLTLKGGEAEHYTPHIDSSGKDSAKPLRAKEIGNRPKELDHIVLILPEKNDYTVAPGINPALFKAAKFKLGDILQTINGKDVTVAKELEQANALIATAQTLEFVVLRGGKTVILYLDIPSKNLSISHD